MTVLDEDTDPHCLSPGEAAALLEPAPWRRLVVVGDSVAAGVREPLAGYRDLSSVDRLGDALSSSRTVAFANFGQRDLRVGEIIETQLDPALARHPDLVVVAAGANDAFRRSFDPGTVRAALVALVGPLRQVGATVALIGLYDLARSGLVPEPYATGMAERFDALDVLTADVAAEQGCVFVDNHSHPLSSDPAIYASDRVHCNARGHAIAATTAIRTLHGHLALAYGATAVGLDGRAVGDDR